MEGPSKSSKQDAESLFDRYFWRWHNEEDRRSRRSSGLFPDIFGIPRVPVRSEGYVSEYGKEPSDRWAESLADYAAVADRDFKRIIGVSRQHGIDSLGVIDDYFGEKGFLEQLRQSDPSDDGNAYAVLCCLLGAYTGSAMLQAEPQLVWWVDGPQWDCRIVHRRSGMVAPVFHWAIKRLSEDAELLLPKALWYLKEASAAGRVRAY